MERMTSNRFIAKFIAKGLLKIKKKYIVIIR